LQEDTYRDFGKGSSHQAKLNFGDCFAYAPAKTLGKPLLFNDSEFTHTDSHLVRRQKVGCVNLTTDAL
jgi:uncharacterized protein with PIN domain